MQKIYHLRTKKTCNYNETLVRNLNAPKSNVTMSSSEKVIVTEQGIS